MWSEWQQTLAEKGILRLSVRVSPLAAKTELTGVLADGSLKVRLHAVPERGQANTELINFFSRELAVPTTRITIQSGAGARRKIIIIKKV